MTPTTVEQVAALLATKTAQEQIISQQAAFIKTQGRLLLISSCATVALAAMVGVTAWMVDRSPIVPVSISADGRAVLLSRSPAALGPAVNVQHASLDMTMMVNELEAAQKGAAAVARAAGFHGEIILSRGPDCDYIAGIKPAQ